MYGEATTNVDEMNQAASIEVAKICAAKIRAARWRRLTISFWIVSSLIELYFVTRYLTWIEFWRLSGKGMAVGSGFAVALFGVIEVFNVIRVARARRAAQRRAAEFAEIKQVFPNAVRSCGACGADLSTDIAHICAGGPT
jgi:hypothetical protein